MNMHMELKEINQRDEQRQGDIRMHDKIIDITSITQRRQVGNNKFLYNVNKRNHVQISILNKHLTQAGMFPGESRVNISWNVDKQVLVFRVSSNGLLLRKISNRRSGVGFKYQDRMQLPKKRIETDEIYVGIAQEYIEVKLGESHVE